jgi:phosphatidylglycerophosphate synthase
MSFIRAKGDCIVIHAFIASACCESRAALTAGPSLQSGRLQRAAALYVTAGGLCVAGAGLGIASLSPFTFGFLVGALAPYLVVGLIAVARIEAYHPYDRFGGANFLTLIRLVFSALLGGFAFEIAVNGLRPGPSPAWFFCALAMTAVIIDGLDGHTARREGMSSAFGARFDMEVDALQILILCVIAFVLGKAGAWVMVGGVLRYLFEIVSMFWPALRRPLPPSFRRKLVSVIQSVALAGILAPILAPPLSTVIAGVALILLIYSFAVDVIWLAVDDARARQSLS